MSKSPLQQGAYVLGILAALVPFAFALIRAVTTGTDFRYLWMAFAAVLGAVAVVVTVKARTRARSEMLMRSAGVFALSTLFAGCTGYLLGARGTIGVWMVSVAFGLCEAAGFALVNLARHEIDARAA